MRQRTNWIFRAEYKNNNYIRVGWVHNSQYAEGEDVIRIQVQNDLGICDDKYMRIDEACAIASGINKTLAYASLAGGLRITEDGECTTVRNG